MTEPAKPNVSLTAATLRRLRKCISLSPSQWVYLIRACYELLRARILFIAVSDNALISSLQESGPNLNHQELRPCDTLWVLENSKAIRIAAAFVPWRSDCLVQAIAADHLLRGRGLQPSFYLGVKAESTSDFLAHCWLDCCGLQVVGQTNDSFSILIEPEQSCFASMANR